MRALLLLPQVPLEGRDRPVGNLPGLGSRPDNFWRDRVRAADRPGAKNHHLKKSPLPTLPTPPNLPTIPALPTLPTLPALTWRSRTLPRTQGRAPAALERAARLSRCRAGDGSLSLLSVGRRLEAGLGRVRLVRWEKVVRGGQKRGRAVRDSSSDMLLGPGSSRTLVHFIFLHKGLIQVRPF